MGAHPTNPPSYRSVAFGTMAGATIEWYDFYVFGVAAALALNRIFFANVPPAVGTLLAFGTFAVAWFARPLGGIIFSHLGDRIGRKRVMVATLLTMGSATTLIGLLPNYGTIGVTAPILLVIVRIVQGIACGGEWGAATVTAVENAPAGRRGLFGAFPQMGVPAGLFLSSVVSLAFYALPDEQLLSWGWRVPFLLTAVFVVVGQFLRRKLPESAEFTAEKEQGKIARFPLGEALRHHWRGILVILFAEAIVNVGFYTTTTYILDYTTSDGTFQRTTVLAIVAVAALVDIGIVLLAGILSDRFPPKKILLVGIVIGALQFIAIFPLADSGNAIALVVGIAVIWPIAHGLAHGSQPSYFAGLFPTRVRLTGMSVGYQICGTVFSGPLPIIAAALIAVAGGSPWLFVGYTVLVGIVSIIATVAGNPRYTEAEPAPAADVATGATV